MIRFAPWPPKGISGSRLVLQVVTQEPEGMCQTVLTVPVGSDGRVVFDPEQMRAPQQGGLAPVEDWLLAGEVGACVGSLSVHPAGVRAVSAAL